MSKITEINQEEQIKLLSINIYADFLEIARRLEVHHAFFYKLWDMGIPILTFSIPTAAVCFNRKGRQIEFRFNPKFWQESDLYTRLFVVCHECLHVLLNHGIRGKNCKSPMLSNIAMDVVINHMLCDRFGFDRTKVKNWENLCWLDTSFKNFDNIKKDQIYEYYYAILEKNCKVINTNIIIQGNGSGSELYGETLDDHDGLDSFDDKDVMDDVNKELEKILSEEDKESLVKNIGKSEEGKKAAEQKVKEKDGSFCAGTIAGTISYYANVQEIVKKKQKWETVIRSWSIRFKEKYKDAEQWIHTNRRLHLFDHTNILLPSDHEEEYIDKDKIDVFFFQDTSGSCCQFRDRFFKVAKTLPEDRFNVHLHCFDTEVYKVDIKVGNLMGFGGTSFSCIEKYIQNQIKNGLIKKYPPAVFVITDGEACDFVSPMIPKNWYFFLSQKYTKYIHNECNTYMLSEFE